MHFTFNIIIIYKIKNKQSSVLFWNKLFAFFLGEGRKSVPFFNVYIDIVAEAKIGYPSVFRLFPVAHFCHKEITLVQKRKLYQWVWAINSNEADLLRDTSEMIRRFCSCVGSKGSRASQPLLHPVAYVSYSGGVCNLLCQLILYKNLSECLFIPYVRNGVYKIRSFSVIKQTKVNYECSGERYNAYNKYNKIINNNIIK